MDRQLVERLLNRIEGTTGLTFQPVKRRERDDAFRKLLGHLRSSKVRPQHWRDHSSLCQYACRVLRPVLFDVAVADAADVLATMGSAAHQVVPGLIESITSDSTLLDHNLSRVVRALGRVGLSDEAVDAAIRILDQYGDATEGGPEEADGVAPGVEAARALGRLRRSCLDAVAALRGVCGRASVHPRVLLAAGTALWRLGGPEGDPLTPDRQTAVNAVSDCLAATFPRDSAEGRRRAEQAAALVDSDDLLFGAEDLLFETAVAPSPPVPPGPFPEPAVRVLAVRGLRSLGQEAIAAAANHLTIAALADEAEVREAATAAVAVDGYTNLGERTRILIESLATDDSLLGPFACVGRHPSIASESDRQQVASAYLGHLLLRNRSERGTIRNPPGVMGHTLAIIQNVGEPLLKYFVAALADGQSQREATAQLLRYLAQERPDLISGSPAAVAALRPYLDDPSGWVRLDLATALWHAGSPGSDDRVRARAVLGNLVRSETEGERIRSDAAEVIGTFGAAAAPFIPLLEEVGRDMSVFHTIRHAAGRSVDRIRHAGE